jgi:predicted kinase
VSQLILLIGLPGSGKSTLANQLVAKSPGSLIISTDAIRAQLFGHEAIQGPWRLVWHEMQRQFSYAVEQIQLGKVPQAIYDATNAVRRHRREAIALARQTGFTKIVGMWVDTPLLLCLARNRRRDRPVPEAVILRMYCRLQLAPPALEDGFEGLIRYLPPLSTEIAPI